MNLSDTSWPSLHPLRHVERFRKRFVYPNVGGNFVYRNSNC
jgi:hypothetical protein